MGEVAQINFFAALPARVITDDRLTALHFRVLGAIASRDRMGRNGQFCWENPTAIAKRIKCNPKRFSTTVSELVNMGYLERKKSEKDGRKHGLKVVYDLESDAVSMGVDLSKARKSRLRDGNQSNQSRLRDGNLSHVDKSRNNQQKQQGDDASPQTEYIRYKPKYNNEAKIEAQSATKTDAEIQALLALEMGGWEALTSLDEKQLSELIELRRYGAVSGMDLERICATKARA